MNRMIAFLKSDHYVRIQELACRFEEKHGSIICRELLGLDVHHDAPADLQES